MYLYHASFNVKVEGGGGGGARGGGFDQHDLPNGGGFDITCMYLPQDETKT